MWTMEKIEKRFPKLVRQCKKTALLTEGEAISGLRAYLNARTFRSGINPYNGKPCKDGKSEGDYMMRFGGSEAVNHFGGPEKMVQIAVKSWRIQSLAK